LVIPPFPTLWQMGGKKKKKNTEEMDNETSAYFRFLLVKKKKSGDRKCGKRPVPDNRPVDGKAPV